MWYLFHSSCLNAARAASFFVRSCNQPRRPSSYSPPLHARLVVSISTCTPCTRPFGALKVLPFHSTWEAVSWLRICTPEFNPSATLNSTSRMKLVKSRVVQRKVLGVLGCAIPTISLFSILYLALPPFCTQPSRFLPLNKGFQPASSAETAIRVDA